MRVKAKISVTVAVLSILTFGNSAVFAQSSTNYRVDESSFSSGSEFDASSTNFGASGTAGLNAVGDASSTNFDVVAGLITPDVPFLEFVVTGATVDLGVLDPNTTSSGSAQAGACNCSFYVRSYLSSSYSVTTISDPPTSEGNAVLTAKSTQGAPSGSQSVEEFGMNVVANTAPSTMGQNPVNQPNGSFADGVATAEYGTTNQYKYAPGDIIANAAGTANTQAWGMTEYTISYIAKSSPVTPAGLYSMDHVLVATSTY
jgi:hypothetical protein